LAFSIPARPMSKSICTLILNKPEFSSKVSHFLDQSDAKMAPPRGRAIFILQELQDIHVSVNLLHSDNAAGYMRGFSPCPMIRTNVDCQLS